MEVNSLIEDWRETKAIVEMVREINPDGKLYIMELHCDPRSIIGDERGRAYR